MRDVSQVSRRDQLVPRPCTFAVTWNIIPTQSAPMWRVIVIITRFTCAHLLYYIYSRIVLQLLLCNTIHTATLARMFMHITCTKHIVRSPNVFQDCTLCRCPLNGTFTNTNNKDIIQIEKIIYSVRFIIIV